MIFMTMPFIVGSIATAKVIQTAVIFIAINKVGKARKFKKERVQSWKLTQFLEESKSVK
jgi:hypothetical protein